jgi:hypothetical protein
VSAAVNERETAGDLLLAGPTPRDLLADKGFHRRAFAAAQHPCHSADTASGPLSARFASGGRRKVGGRSGA